MLNTQLIILILILTGLLLSKIRIITENSRTTLTNLVIYVFLPCNIFLSFQYDISPEILLRSGIIVLVSFGINFMYIILGKAFFFRLRPERKVVAQYATIVSNAGFMGLPIIEAVYGPLGVMYGSFFLIPMRISMWTFGLSLFTKTSSKHKLKTLATHPCIWAVFFGLGYAFAPFSLPMFVSSAVSALSVSTLAMSMLVVGSILGGVDIKTINDKDCYYYSFLRLILIPAIVFVVLFALGVDTIVTGTAVLAAAMPAGIVTAMLAEKYGKDSVFASQIVLVSTALSIITLPIIAEVLVRIT